MTFAREFDMKKHLKKQHMSEKPLPCNKCGKSFPDRYNLKVHKCKGKLSGLEIRLKPEDWHLCTLYMEDLEEKETPSMDIEH